MVSQFVKESIKFHILVYIISSILFTICYGEDRVVPPYFSIPPETLYEVMPGSWLNITCVAVGSPMPVVIWKKGHQEILSESAPPVGKNVLRIDDARESANYTCVASSKLGQIEAQTRIIVQALPRAPANVRFSDVTSQSVRLTWSYDSGSENIIYFVIQYKPKNSNKPLLEISGITTYFVVINALTPYTEYEFYVIAVNSIGRGTQSSPVTLTTGESEPGGAPRNLEARPLSSTNILLHWDQPEAANGPVTGYKVYYTVTPTLPLNAWTTQTVDSNELTTVSDLQPHMIYTMRVAAITARGNGPLSAPVQVKTQQGVPSQPKGLRALSISATTVQLAWKKPQDVGETVIGYEIYWNDTFTQQQSHRSIPVVESFTLGELHPDTVYFIWVSAKSRHGEGAPTPIIPVRTEQYVPGEPRGAKYKFRRSGKNSIGSASMKVTVRTPDNVPSAPTNVQAMATSEQSLEVWWEQMPYFGHVLGYQVLYSQHPVEDLDLWYSKKIPLTWNTELTGLEPNTMYAIRVAAYTNSGLGRLSELISTRTEPTDVPNLLRSFSVTTHTMTLSWKEPKKLNPVNYVIKYGAHKEFYDSQGLLIELPMETKTIKVAPNMTEYKIDGLMPFTSYQVNVTASPPDNTYRPAAKLTVTTAMAAPKPMVKPDSLGSPNGLELTVILPQASEEYGPISHYFLVVVPLGSVEKDTNSYSLQELTTNSSGPYIAAKFARRTIPSTFSLGDGKRYNGFSNKLLQKEQSYRIFVRAVVDTPFMELFTSSPFSDPLSLTSGLEARNVQPVPLNASSSDSSLSIVSALYRYLLSLF